MNKIFLLLSISLAIYNCQELVLSSWEGYYNTGNRFEKSYQRPEWNNEKDIAVYGWFKINTAFPRGAWSVIFHLTHNPDGIFKNANIPGDRCLGVFAQHNKVSPSTYTKGDNNVISNVNYEANDLNQWAFFYIGHGSAQSRLRFYFQFKTSTGQGIYQKIVHTTSTYYKIFIGQSVNYKFFQGQIANVYLHVGNNSYRETNYQPLYDNTNPTNPVLPNPVPSCITLYYECYFKGTPISACGIINDLDISRIKSIYIPENQWFTIYGANDLQGKSIKISQTQQCIDQLNWSLVEVSSQKKHLKKNVN